MPIRILSADVANQIAAGEVVERPSSVVKELIENSLDAGATDVRVEVREGGQRLIRVQDDGCGIAAADTANLFHRHATSKIASTEDLDQLQTLGFRGEALASIASVAQVTLLSRTAGESVGVLMRGGAGREMAGEPSGTAPGTTITVEHLFANVPARLKFLKQQATEAGRILQIVSRYAMAYPERRFSLISDGKMGFQSNGSGKLYDVLVKAYGLEAAGQMIPLVAAATDLGKRAPGPPAGKPAIHVTGYVGLPSQHRSNRNHITLYVNRRWFQDSSLIFGVAQAYHTLLPAGRYPVAIVMIEIDPAEVDVNVHPTKAEVRFRDNGAVFSAVQRTVRRALTENAPIPQANLGSTPVQPGGGVQWEQMPAHLPADSSDSAWSARRDALLAAGSQLRPTIGGAQGFDPSRASEQAPATGQPAAGLPAAPVVRAPMMPLLRVIGQIASLYIVAEGPDGMYLIDQHAAHERVLYEQLLGAQQGGHLQVQPLLEPVVLDLSPESAATVAQALSGLRELGVELEPFGGHSYLARSVPAILSHQNPQSALLEIIDGLGEGTNAVADHSENVLIALICKRAAIKGGQVLSPPEMQELVRQLENCLSPRTCPHGRPTMVHVTALELARQFGRT